jgi:hypothetical protein
MRRASKRCSTPGCNYAATRNGYCEERCSLRYERARRRTTPTKRARTTEVRKHRATAILDYLEANGGRAHCPGWGAPPHDCAPEDLTADDPVAIARGGDPLQPVVPMCRACNGRKGAN